MTMKYKITANHLQEKGGVEKLLRDGATRETISKALYRELNGSSQKQKQDTLSQLYDKR